jgi:replicative DNA helicase
MEKLLAQKTQIDQEKIQRGKLETDEWKALFDQGGKPLKDTSLIIDESIGATITNLEDNSSQYFKGKNPDIIIIDGLKQFLDLNELNLSIDIAEILKKLKRIAISMNIPVVIFSEEIELLEYSGRSFETRKFELQDNCTFKKEADVVIQMCRIENYNHLEMKSDANTDGVYLKITKNQTGLLDTFKFIPFFHILKFNEAVYGSL